MSTSYTCDIHCDKCGQWIHGATDNSPARLATRAVEKAKRNGWSRSTKSMFTDLCPECLAEARKDGTA